MVFEWQDAGGTQKNGLTLQHKSAASEGRAPSFSLLCAHTASTGWAGMVNL